MPSDETPNPENVVSAVAFLFEYLVRFAAFLCGGFAVAHEGCVSLFWGPLIGLVLIWIARMVGLLERNG